MEDQCLGYIRIIRADTSVCMANWLRCVQELCEDLSTESKRGSFCKNEEW